MDSATNQTGSGSGQSSPTATPRDCKLVQRLAVKETGETVFMTTVLPAARKGQFVSILSAPPGGYLVPGMEMKIDNGQKYKVLFETCNAAGCHGGFEMGGTLLRQFQTGREATVRVWTTKAKSADVKISLSGFPKAFAALREATK